MENNNNGIADIDLDELGIGVILIDEKLKISEVSPLASKVFGISREDIGKNINDIEFLPDCPGLISDVNNILSVKAPCEHEFEDGNKMVWNVRLSICGENNIVVSIYDVTSMLFKIKQNTDITMASFPGGVVRFAYKKSLIVDLANKNFYEMEGYSKEEFVSEIDNRYEKLMLPEDWTSLKKLIEKSIVDEKYFTLEFRSKGKDRGYAWRRIRGVACRSNDQKTYIYSTIGDIDEIKSNETRYRSLVDNLNCGLIRVYYDGEQPVIEYVSKSFFRMIGMSKEEYYAKFEEITRNGTIFPEVCNERGMSLLKEFFETDKKTDSFEFSVVKADKTEAAAGVGDTRWYEIGFTVVEKNKKYVVVQCLVLDISEKRRALEEVRKSRAKLSAIAGLSADSIFEYSFASDTMLFYSHFQTPDSPFTSRSISSAFLNRLLNTDRFIHPDDKHLVEETIHRIKKGATNFYMEIRKKKKQGKYVWLAVEGRVVADKATNDKRVFGKFKDIDEKKKKEEALRYQSERDSLTGLYNNKVTKKKICEMLDDLDQPNTFCIAVDIDNFKDINDTMGHLYGDTVICSFANTISETFKDSIIGRIGGDEFAVLVFNSNGIEIKEKCQKVNETLAKIFEGDSDFVSISASFGVTECMKQMTYDDIFMRADAALYYLKENGKGDIAFYRPDMSLSQRTFEEDTLYLDDRKKSEAVVRNESDLVIFALEIFENVKDAKGAICALADSMSRFYQFSIMFMVRSEGDRSDVIFEWGTTSGKHFVVSSLSDEQHSALWNEVNSNSEESIMHLSNAVADGFGYEAKNVFAVKTVDNGKDAVLLFVETRYKRNENRRGTYETVSRLANIIFKKLQLIETNQKIAEEAEYAANYDRITGLFNYPHFIEESEAYVKNNPQKKFFVVYLDFTNFQLINELAGFQEGDTILGEFGRLLTSSFDGVFHSRVTADKFISLYEYTHYETKAAEIEKKCNSFCKKLNRRYPDCKLSVCIGVAKINRKNISFASNVDNANVARKILKQSGTQNILLFNSRLKSNIVQQREIESSMEKAFLRGEFKLFLQPKVDIYTGQVVGAESLVRWVPHEGVIIEPKDFVPIFEKNGFIMNIDFEMLRQTLELQRSILNQGKKMLPISVNFSRKHQETPDYPERIKNMLAKYEVPAKYIEIEITESVFMYDIEPLSKSLNEIRESGISISIDDFGAGYSSLNVLARVKADTVKLDRKFLLDVEKQSGNLSKRFMTSLIDMVKQLGLNVIAEGVETEHQVKLLKQTGCRFAQGFYYAKPLPVDEFIEYLEVANA